MTKEDQPTKPKRGRPARGDKARQTLNSNQGDGTKRSKSVAQTIGGLDKWIGEPKNAYNKYDQSVRKTQNSQEGTFACKTGTSGKNSSCNCVKLDWKSV